MTSGTKPQGGQVSQRRWLWPVLVASLMVNLLVIGALAGSMFSRGPDGGFWTRNGRGGFGLSGYARTLPNDRASAVLSAIELQRPQLREIGREARRQHGDTVKALTAEPFDKAAFQQSLDRFGEMELRFKRAVYATISEGVAMLTPAERQGYIAWANAQRPWFKKRRRSHEDASEAERK